MMLLASALQQGTTNVGFFFKGDKNGSCFGLKLLGKPKKKHFNRGTLKLIKI